MTPEREAQIRRDAYGFGAYSFAIHLRETLEELDRQRAENRRLKAELAKINGAMDVLLQGYSDRMVRQ